MKKQLWEYIPLIIIAICGIIILLSITHKKPKQYKIALIYHDNTEELLIYNELPRIISTDSSTFCVVDSECTICGVKYFKIIQ